MDVSAVGELDAQIEQYKAQIQVLHKELEDMVPSIIEAAAQHTFTWSKAKARAVSQKVLERSSRQEELGKNMVNLKDDVNELQNRLPDETKKILSPDNLWPHRRYDLATYSMSRSGGIQREWKDAKEILYGYVGELLFKHGFQPTYEDEWIKPLSFEHSSNQYYRYTLKPQYAGQPRDDFDTIRDAYNKKWSDLSEVRSQMVKVESQKAKIQAEATANAVWDD